MEYSDKYVDSHQHLRVYKGKDAYKFCKHCCQEVRAKADKLNKHYNKHPGEEPAFLSYFETAKK